MIGIFCYRFNYLGLKFSLVPPTRKLELLEIAAAHSPRHFSSSCLRSKAKTAKIAIIHRFILAFLSIAYLIPLASSTDNTSSSISLPFVKRDNNNSHEPNEHIIANSNSIKMTNPNEEILIDSNPQNSAEQHDRVCIIGSGNWGSAIATLVGRNCARLPHVETQVSMWVYEEMVQLEDGTERKLTEVINEQHENVKYLPGIKLPENVVAVPDLAEACDQATLLIFVLPHQFLPRLMPTIKANCHPSCRGVSLIKGLGKYLMCICICGLFVRLLDVGEVERRIGHGSSNEIGRRIPGISCNPNLALSEYVSERHAKMRMWRENHDLPLCGPNSNLFCLSMYKHQYLTYSSPLYPRNQSNMCRLLPRHQEPGPHQPLNRGGHGR